MQFHRKYACIPETTVTSHGFIKIFGPGIYSDIKMVQVFTWIYPCMQEQIDQVHQVDQEFLLYHSNKQLA